MQNNEIIIERAIALAETWQNRATELVSDFDRAFHIKMNKMLSHPKDKVFLIELMDQSFRSKNPARVANQIEYLFPNTKWHLFSRVLSVFWSFYFFMRVFICRRFRFHSLSATSEKTPKPLCSKVKMTSSMRI